MFLTAKSKIDCGREGGRVREGVTTDEGETHLTFGMTKLVHLVDNWQDTNWLRSQYWSV